MQNQIQQGKLLTIETEKFRDQRRTSIINSNNSGVSIEKILVQENM
jgi:hypothetical protein